MYMRFYIWWHSQSETGVKNDMRAFSNFTDTNSWQYKACRGTT
jgi:hypothetical protein